ncbi:hypothetical protein ACFYWX_07805 [Streptomyces sp. NPDC002888]|uniref:hypothetical protein n=1 Tax=Streptomyces sp. NPDC002888 TaxID=3364668 RepID=UPI0036D206A8
MRKYQKAAVVAAMLGSVSFLGAGVGHADGNPKLDLDNKQNQACEQSEVHQGLINIDDVNLSLAILGLSNQPVDERNSVNCTQNFALGK